MTTHVYGDSPCPHDPAFVHRVYFGCVPADFRERTGKSKTHHQTPPSPPGVRYRWNGGCDALPAPDGERGTA